MAEWFACEICRRPISNQASPLCHVCRASRNSTPRATLARSKAKEKEPPPPLITDEFGVDVRDWLDEPDDDESPDERRYSRWLEDCGKIGSGICLKAGSEECDWECPFHP